MKLPLNCVAEYYTGFLSKEESQQLYNILIDTYQIDQSRISLPGSAGKSDFGKLMFIDKDIYDSNELPEAQWGKSLVWFEELLAIKSRVQDISQGIFNVCVCIYYPDGNSGVGFHSDFKAFGETDLIPSLSIGEEREFQLREKETQKVFSKNLEEGSLLIMGENCQERYEHSLPVNPIYNNGRINLTFRPFENNKT